VAAAEALATASEGDHMHVGIQVRPLDAVGQLARCLEGDRVGALGAVERDARDPPVDLVVEGAHAPRVRSTIAAVSTPAGSVPNARPPVPSRAQKASATASGAYRTS